MISVVVMAGYKPSEIEDYKRQLKYYREKYTEKGYKALKEFKVREGGRIVRRPLIEFVLRKIDDIFDVNDVVIVGDRKKLQEKLSDWFASSKKKYTLVDQNDRFSEKILRDFHIDPEQVPYDSIAGNAAKAYALTDACRNRQHALFIASDSPTTQKKSIEEFIAAAQTLTKEAALIYPMASMQELPRWRKCFHRKYLFLVNDTPYKFSNSFTTWFTKREGFRPSCMLLANPFRFDMNRVNLVYSARKMVSSEVRKRVKEILYSHGFAGIWKRYFMTKDVSITDGERVVSAVLKGTVKVLPIRDVDSSYDYDGTKTEEDAITRFLQEE